MPLEANYDGYLTRKVEKPMKKKDSKEIFSYDDNAVNEVHNQITDAYSSGVVGEQYSSNAYQPVEEESQHTPNE
ncbi:hypothetical protein [Sutcliffiella sp. FSL R7-0096]|uniref:hypothetical protein n=2 Tax=unclassified Sutcliffiella TaxID=2837532 RepID=UPI00315B28F8